MTKKLIQFIGTRNKSDFILYLSHVLTSLNKRVLVIDGTQNEVYKHGYGPAGTNNIFDFQGIDILASVSNWADIDQNLKKYDETIEDYDIVIMDIDTPELLKHEWPMFNDRFYVGDFDRSNQQRDVKLIRTLLESTGSSKIKRITFESDYQIDDEYFDMQLTEPVEWNSMNYKFEPDEVMEVLRFKMQHEQIIPFSKLNKQYKNMLTEIISALYELHVQEIEDAVKPSFFKSLFRRDKASVPGNA